MTPTALKQTALTVSSATAELITKILVQFPQAHIQPRSIPLTDEDISLEVILPMSMTDIYQAREWMYNLVIELQEHYDVIIMVSVIPPEGQATSDPRGQPA